MTQLRSDLAAAKNEFSKLRATQLDETSETLVVAAAHADSVAQSAVTSLDELNLYSQLDELTGLPTRTLLLDRLENTLAAAQRRGTRFGVVFIDLDGFKQINDTLGHAAGDQVLQIATQRLQSVVRESDTVSRHGGDEFILLFPEINLAADLAPVADKILAALAEPTHVMGDVLHLSASIGIAVFPEDGTDASILLGHADAAMYRSKKRGSGNYEFHVDAQASDTTAPESLPVVPLMRRTDVVFAEHESRLRMLRDANHELLEAARVDQKMRAHAEQARQRQIDFVAMAAHAMRSPLSAIKLTVSTMRRDSPGRPVPSQRLDMLERQSQHLARLIDDLLEGSMVGGSGFKLERTPLALDAVLDSAVEASRHVLTLKGQTLHLRRCSAAATVFADAMRVTQLFGNLLKNASRRAPTGGSVWLSADVDGARALFTVADNGAFIDPAALDRIFELYTHDKSLPLDDAGLGIGLAVARELAQAHGGTLVARNAARGEGSEFVVSLPSATGVA
ncbi:MAG: diguanylate cyclase [Caldimonas sp.]